MGHLPEFSLDLLMPWLGLFDFLNHSWVHIYRASLNTKWDRAFLYAQFPMPSFSLPRQTAPPVSSRVSGGSLSALLDRPLLSQGSGSHKELCCFSTVPWNQGCEWPQGQREWPCSHRALGLLGNCLQKKIGEVIVSVGKSPLHRLTPSDDEVAECCIWRGKTLLEKGSYSDKGLKDGTFHSPNIMCLFSWLALDSAIRCPEQESV